MQSGSADMAQAAVDLSRYGTKWAGRRPESKAGRVHLMSSAKSRVGQNPANLCCPDRVKDEPVLPPG
jgi:hypothetical protein